MHTVRTATPEQIRLPELDALRGLAAFSVLLGHLFLFAQTDSTSRLARFLYGLYPYPVGHDAVILFFVLSGFVLSLPAIDGRPQPYAVFLIRRIFRIYPAYLLMLLLAVAGCALLGQPATHSEWLNSYWAGGVHVSDVARHVLLVRRFDISLFNPVVWTLVHEMRISLLFPLLCAVVLRLRPAMALMAAAAVSCVLEFLPGMGSAADDSPMLTLHYAMLFVLGIVLARERSRLVAAVKGLARFHRILLLSTVAALYVFAGDFPPQRLGSWTERETPLIIDWVTALGAAGLIVFALAWPRMRALLAWKPVRLLAEMSYSLYLLHFVVLLAGARLLYGHMPLPLLLLLCLIVSLAVARCAFVWVERPGIRLGRSVSERWARLSLRSS